MSAMPQNDKIKFHVYWQIDNEQLLSFVIFTHECAVIFVFEETS
jgi:hypothetical protein